MKRERPGARLTGRLTLLVASMRAGGARVGIGELLAAHRALAAIDPSDRNTAYFALRASLCSRRDDLAAFDAAFAEWFTAPPPESSEPPPALDEVASLVLPRVTMPSPELRQPALPEEVEVLPAAWSDVELLKDKDFADYTDAERHVARSIMRRLAGTGPTRPTRRTPPAPIYAARSARRCAAVASRSSATGGSRASARVSSCSSATCPARWSRMRACCSSTCRHA